ncbi:hypothetical protein VTI28DRAFT_10574 [Corynascus sepedonium]
MAQSAEKEYKLAYYETNAYSVATCAMYFTDNPDGKADENPTIGKTFRWADDSRPNGAEENRRLKNGMKQKRS